MALDDWLRAERDELEIPKSELTEEDGKIHVRAAVPGLTPKDLHVTATPHELVIRGEVTHEDEGERGKVHFREFSEKQMFRRYGLPAEVDVEHVQANLKDGVLDIDLPKVAQREVTVAEEGGRAAKKTAA
jgi:HSP20 family protein